MSAHDPIHHADGSRSSPGPREQTESTLANVSRIVTVANSLGLHMRPVMQFVDLANQFQSRILVKKGNHAVDGKNPMELMLLEATQETELEIRAEGPDAAEAVESLIALVKRGFGEE